MIAVNNEAGCWPTRNQELMLRAALLQREPALESWNEWKRNVNIDVIDYGSHRMVPQLYRNLQRHGVKEQLMERLKGVYRYYLYKNEILMHRIATLLAAFDCLRPSRRCISGLDLNLRALLAAKIFGLKNCK